MDNALDRLEAYTRKELARTEASIEVAREKLSRASEPEERRRLEEIIGRLKAERDAAYERLGAIDRRKSICGDEESPD
jgi:hypothetical protein